MPKSRNRKDHAKKASAYKRRVEDARKSWEKQMRAMYDAQHQQMLDNQIAGNGPESSQIDGLNIEDFELEQEPVGVVEGVTNPDQL